MDFQKVSFKNKDLDLNLAGILYTPDDLDVSKSYPAVVVTGPMLPSSARRFAYTL